MALDMLLLMSAYIGNTSDLKLDPNYQDHKK